MRDRDPPGRGGVGPAPAVATAATVRYLTHGHASPVLLVHTATAPNAVLHTLPALPRHLWGPSLAAVWAASAALVSAYAPREGAPRAVLPVVEPGTDTVTGIVDRAAAHGDEHVIKFTDTAADAFAHTGDPAPRCRVDEAASEVDG